MNKSGFIMRKILVSIFILKTSVIFSQNFNDKIIATTGDTIRCQITLVNNNNIFYDLKVKRSITHEIISLHQVKTYFIDANNKPEILCKNRDSVKVNTNNNSYTGKYLIVEKGIDKHVFKPGQKVSIVEFNNDKLEKGKIECISDSAIMLKGSLIKIKNIKKISKYKGVVLAKVGIASFVFFASTSYISNNLYLDNEDDNSDGEVPAVPIISAFFATVSLIAEIPAIIEVATTKHYKMDKGWRLTVK